MEGVEQEAGAARPGAHDAPDAVAAHDTIDTTEAHAAKAAATAAPKRPKSVHSPILKWWKEHAALFPYLSQVARRYLAMPATSASVERLFSVAGQVVTAKRNRLHPSSVTLLVFLHEAIPGVIEREARAIIQDKMLVE